MIGFGTGGFDGRGILGRTVDRILLEWRMREVPTTEVKSRFAEMLRIVEHGESIAITRHGKTVAHLVPAVDRERVSRREAVEHREAQFVDDEEMAEILNDDALVRRMRTGSRQAHRRGHA